MKNTTKTAKKETELVSLAHAIEAADHEVKLSRADETNKQKLVDISIDRRKKAESVLTNLKKKLSDTLKNIE